jgi:hypothetical protein
MQKKPTLFGPLGTAAVKHEAPWLTAPPVHPEKEMEPFSEINDCSKFERLSGLVPGYRPRCRGFDSRRYQIF